MSRLGQALRVFVAGAVHAQNLGLLVHHLDKAFYRAADAFSQSYRGVIARLNNHALDQIFNGHFHFGVDEHPRSWHFPSALTHSHALLEVNFFGFQGFKNQISSHEFGQ